MISYTLVILVLVSLFSYGGSENKYSAKANEKQEGPQILNPTVTFRTLEKPFRMAKINMLWSKAQRVSCYCL